MTARLSQRFHDKLGEDIANELVDWFNAVDATYRADLRELNELNFTRFDAKLEQRLAELRSELRAEFQVGFAAQGARLDVLRAELRQGMADLRGELLRWAFLFWVTTLGALYAFTR